MEWKDFIFEVEKELKKHGIDPERHSVQINYIDFSCEVTSVEVDIDEKGAELSIT